MFVLFFVCEHVFFFFAKCTRKIKQYIIASFLYFLFVCLFFFFKICFFQNVLERDRIAIFLFLDFYGFFLFKIF